MIFGNGSIRFKKKTGGGLDGMGYPVKADVSWGEEIECQWRKVKEDYQAQTQGENYTERSLEILIEGIDRVESEILELRDDDGVIVGEFSVVRIDRLKAVDKTRITA